MFAKIKMWIRLLKEYFYFGKILTRNIGRKPDSLGSLERACLETSTVLYFLYMSRNDEINKYERCRLDNLTKHICDWWYE